jgi:hypothetical protein
MANSRVPLANERRDDTVNATAASASATSKSDRQRRPDLAGRHAVFGLAWRVAVAASAVRGSGPTRRDVGRGGPGATEFDGSLRGRLGACGNRRGCCSLASASRQTVKSNAIPRHLSPS